MTATSGQNTNASQNQGIVITYGKRYAYENAFGIATGIEDTDGRGADESLDDEQIEHLRKGIELTGTDLDSFLLWGASPSLEQFPPNKYKAACDLLSGKADKKAAKAKKQQEGADDAN